jgi:hypothetical protein
MPIKRWNGATWTILYPDPSTTNVNNTLVQRGESGEIAAGQITGTSLTSSGTLTVNGTTFTMPTNNSDLILGSSATSGDRLRLHRSSTNTYIDFGSGNLFVRPNGSTNAIEIVQSNSVTRILKPSTEYVGSASANAAQSITSATWTQINLQVDDFDYADMHSTTTNTPRVLITVPGVYHFSGQVPFDANSSNSRAIRLAKYNTSAPTTLIEYRNAAIDAGDSATTQLSLSVSALILCAANDFIALEAWHDRGSALSVSNGFGLTARLSWNLVRATP